MASALAGRRGRDRNVCLRALLPVRLAGHPLFFSAAVCHLPHFTMWFRGSGRFAWPLYYLVMALTLAAVARSARPWLAFLLLAAAFALQLADLRKLRAVERRDYEWPWPRLESPVWTGLGHSFRSVRLVPPIVANRVACARYGRNFDWEIRFGVMAARERMTFNSSNPARVDSLVAALPPYARQSPERAAGPWVLYIPKRLSGGIEWWVRGRLVCRTGEGGSLLQSRVHQATAIILWLVFSSRGSLRAAGGVPCCPAGDNAGLSTADRFVASSGVPPVAAVLGRSLRLSSSSSPVWPAPPRRCGLRRGFAGLYADHSHLR